MKKYRIRYFIATIITIFFTIYFANRVLFAISMIMLLLPLYLRLTLYLNVNGFRLDISAKDSTIIKSDIGLCVSYDCNFLLSVAGLLVIEAEFFNNAFEVVARKKYVVPVCQNSDSIKLPYSAKYCGKLSVRFKTIRLCDFLGIFSIRLDKKEDKNIVIYPRRLDISTVIGRQNENSVNIGHINSGKKGNDATEIFYLREYQEGDSLKNIHWKLSSKHDKLIVKQNSDLLSYDILYYIDISIEKNGRQYLKSQISTVLEAGINIGQSIVASNIKYEIAFPIGNTLLSTPISSIEDHYKALEDALNSRINPNMDVNLLLEKYITRILNKGYSKFILVCWEVYPPILDYLSNFLEVVVIVVYDHNKKLDMVSRQNLHIITLADDKIFSDSITLNI